MPPSPETRLPRRGTARLRLVSLVGGTHLGGIERRHDGPSVDARHGEERTLDRLVLIEQVRRVEPRELECAHRRQLAPGMAQARGDERAACASARDRPLSWLGRERHSVAVAEGARAARLARGRRALARLLAQDDHDESPVDPVAVAPAQHAQRRVRRVAPGTGRIVVEGGEDHHSRLHTRKLPSAMGVSPFVQTRAPIFVPMELSSP